jgi:hypothetical protein
VSVGTLIKRSFQGLGCLVLLGIVLLSGAGSISSYYENNPEAQKRLEVSAKDAELRVDEDAPFWTKVGVLITSWWHSDELIAEAQTEKALEEQIKAKNRAEEESHRFNNGYDSSGSDYYPSQD